MFSISIKTVSNYGIELLILNIKNDYLLQCTYFSEYLKINTIYLSEDKF